MRHELQIHQAQEQLLDLIERVQAGEEFGIMRGDKPIAKLIKPPKRPAIGELEASFVGVDTDLLDEPDDEFNKGFHKDI